MARDLSWGDIGSHNAKNDLYIVIERRVYDVTHFQQQHPGGAELLLDQGGTDVTELFEDTSHSNEARSKLLDLCVGTVKDEPTRTKPTAVGNKGDKEAKLESLSSTKPREAYNLAMATLVLFSMGLLSCAFYWVSRQLMNRIEDMVRASRGNAKLEN
ncbi:hypothetical protein RBB50_005049 [Rhinocladiella similis]